MPSSRILELGCGLGNFAVALSDYLQGGSYYGLDISASHIESCSNRFRRFSDFKFAHIDVDQPSYNFLLKRERSQGKPNAVEVTLSLRDAWFTLQVSHSVFTHMYTNQVRNYLKQIHKAMVSGGVIANSVFVIDEFARESIKAGNATHPFVHERDGFFWYYQSDPLMGSTFSKELLLSLHAEAGFKDITWFPGTWTGKTGEFYQDILVSTKP